MSSKRENFKQQLLNNGVSEAYADRMAGILIKDQAGSTRSAEDNDLAGQCAIQINRARN